MTNKTCYQENEEGIARCQQILADGLGTPSLWQDWLNKRLKSRALYQDTELKERPKVDYGDWVIVFEDDEDMIAFLDEEIAGWEMSPDDADDLYEGVAIEYVLMTGVELGQLQYLEM
jgi:hypothetical protein